jgi:UDP-N-acetylmuramyl pentapeptide phosphotransferase/UDP-N-acetylglucosamine-1-phosphate transferase
LALISFLGLAAVSWRDDRASLPVTIRLATQIVAVGLGLVAMPSSGLAFQGYLPPAVETALIALAWLWFINLFNFMDGIDGLSGVETLSIGIGACLLLIAISLSAPVAILAAAMGGAALGFLFWNWSPAKLFMGDVGSIPLGFIAGFVLIYLAKEGHIMPALILPMYYLVDATATMLIRLSRNEAVWKAHRTHAYQIAAAATSHAGVATKIAALNFGLIILATLTARYAEGQIMNLLSLVTALIATVGLYLRLRSSGDAH